MANRGRVRHAATVGVLGHNHKAFNVAVGEPGVLENPLRSRLAKVGSILIGSFAGYASHADFVLERSTLNSEGFGPFAGIAEPFFRYKMCHRSNTNHGLSFLREIDLAHFGPIGDDQCFGELPVKRRQIPQRQATLVAWYRV